MKKNFALLALILTTPSLNISAADPAPDMLTTLSNLLAGEDEDRTRAFEVLTDETDIIDDENADAIGRLVSDNWRDNDDHKEVQHAILTKCARQIAAQKIAAINSNQDSKYVSIGLKIQVAASQISKEYGSPISRFGLCIIKEVMGMALQLLS